MISESLHIIAQEELKKCEKDPAHRIFTFMIFCKAIADINPISCFSWALDLVKAEISRMDLEQDQLLIDTLQEVNLVLQKSSKDQMDRLDELAMKNWRERISVEEGISTKGAMAGLCWAALGLCTYRDGIRNESFKSKKTINLIFQESARAIFMMFDYQKEKLRFVAESFSGEMERIS